MDVIVKPIVTEKMNGQKEKLNRYGFIVAKEANKIQIKEAVEKFYSVSVESVNTLICGGKSKSRYTKNGLIVGKAPSYKKAIVTLVDGDTINFYENI